MLLHYKIDDVVEFLFGSLNPAAHRTSAVKNEHEIKTEFLLEDSFERLENLQILVGLHKSCGKCL